jgi:uncharacterized membrane protein YgdD (TMEM256/DUF423 family)
VSGWRDLLIPRFRVLQYNKIDLNRWLHFRQRLTLPLSLYPISMKFMIQAGGILGALAVALGAFGAHALKGMLEASGRTETFETAVKYQFYHAIAMVLVGLLMQRAGTDAVKLLGWSGNAFAIGVIIFSGSLYAICFTGITKFGATAPIGGLALIAGWVLLILAAGRF